MLMTARISLMRGEMRRFVKSPKCSPRSPSRVQLMSFAFQKTTDAWLPGKYSCVECLWLLGVNYIPNQHSLEVHLNGRFVFSVYSVGNAAHVVGVAVGRDRVWQREADDTAAVSSTPVDAMRCAHVQIMQQARIEQKFSAKSKRWLDWPAVLTARARAAATMPTNNKMLISGHSR